MFERLIDEAIADNRIIGLFTKRTEEEGYTGFDQLYTMGTAGVILKMLRMPDGSVRLLVHGIRQDAVTM